MPGGGWTSGECTPTRSSPRPVADGKWDINTPAPSLRGELDQAFLPFGNSGCPWPCCLWCLHPPLWAGLCVWLHYILDDSSPACENVKRTFSSILISSQNSSVMRSTNPCSFLRCLAELYPKLYIWKCTLLYILLFFYVMVRTFYY